MSKGRAKYYLAYFKQPRNRFVYPVANECEMIGLSAETPLEIFQYNYGHYYRGLVGPFKTPGAAMLACLRAGRAFTISEIEKEYARMFKFNREEIKNEYRRVWRSGGLMYRDTKKHVAYTGRIEDFGKR